MLARQSESKARELAQEQSQLALDAIREYNTGVTRDFLLRQPGMENLRKSLLQAPIHFYRRLAQNIEQNGVTDPVARARLGQAQLDLGELINEIGVVEDAIVNFEQARDNLEKVVREVPTAPEYRFLLARARCFLANRYDKASRPEDARKGFDQSLSDFEQLAQANPKVRRYRAHQAEALQLRADFLWDHGDLAGSRRDYLASIAIGAALLLEDPGDLEVMDKHASSLNNVSILFGEAGQWQERLRTLTESTALREKLVAATPTDDPRRDRFLSNLGSCYGNLGSTHLDDGALDESIVWTRKALAIQDAQIKTHPNSVDYLERVGVNHMVLGQLELRSGHLTTARTELEQARAHLERLTQVRPGDAVFRMHLVACLGTLSDVEVASSATTLALNLARRAASEAEDILRKNPKYHPASQGLADQLFREAEISSGPRRIRTGRDEPGSRGGNPPPACRVLPRIGRISRRPRKRDRRPRPDRAGSGSQRRRRGATSRGHVPRGVSSSRRSQSDIKPLKHRFNWFRPGHRARAAGPISRGPVALQSRLRPARKGAQAITHGPASSPHAGPDTGQPRRVSRATRKNKRVARGSRPHPQCGSVTHRSRQSPPVSHALGPRIRPAARTPVVPAVDDGSPLPGSTVCWWAWLADDVNQRPPQSSDAGGRRASCPRKNLPILFRTATSPTRPPRPRTGPR